MARKPSVPKKETVAASAAAPKKSAAPRRHTKATPTAPAVNATSDAPVAEGTPAAPAVPVAAAPIVLDRNDVARIAYSFFAARNYQHGHEVEDWFRAENELRRRLASR